jgi:cell division cycle protein 37
LAASLSSPPNGLSPEAFYNQTVEKLKTHPSNAKPPTGNPQQKTYDALMLEYLMKSVDNVKAAGKDGDIGARLKAEVENHVTQLEKRNTAQQKELDKEEKEQKKHITSDDLKDGFDSKVCAFCPSYDLYFPNHGVQYIPPKPEPPPVPGAKKTKTTEFEVLNPKASSSSSPPDAPTTAAAADEEDEDEALPALTPALTLFSKLPIRGYQASWEFIQSHRDVIVPGASDALLVAAFRAQREGNEEYARKCVHQSLLLQYCDKLGGDGVRVFFNKFGIFLILFDESPIFDILFI